MAKKRQSSKATDKGDASKAKPEDLENAISDAQEKIDETTAATDPESTAEPEPTPVPEETAAMEPEEATDAPKDPDGDPESTSVDETETPDTDEDTAETEADEAEVVEADSSETDDHSEVAEDAEDQEKSEDADDLIEAEAIEAAEDATAEEQPAEPQEDVAATVAAPQTVTKIVKGSIWPGFFGGVIAALVGFIIGRGDALDAYLPESLQRPTTDTSALEAAADTLTAQAQELADLAEAQDARIAALENAEPAAAPAADVSGLEAQLAELTARLAEVEGRPMAAPAPDNSAAEAALAEMQATLAAQQAELEALAAQAAEAEERAVGEASRVLARAALMRVQVAVDSGEAFSPALTELEEVTPVDVPEALREAAPSGVPTLATLQDEFPDAARAGLAAARAEVPESEVAGLSGFIRRQLNVRSVTPREGTDPDAVLSRAQAAVRAGDLGTALTEMEALPDAARAAMQDWLDAASARKAAQDAANELADSLNSN